MGSSGINSDYNDHNDDYNDHNDHNNNHNNHHYNNDYNDHNDDYNDHNDHNNNDNNYYYHHYNYNNHHYNNDYNDHNDGRMLSCLYRGLQCLQHIMWREFRLIPNSFGFFTNFINNFLCLDHHSYLNSLLYRCLIFANSFMVSSFWVNI